VARRVIAEAQHIPVLQSQLRHSPWADPRFRRLPGVQPLDPADWLLVDDAHAGQMAARDTLIARSPDKVHALAPAAAAAARELLADTLARLPALPGYRMSGGQVIRPDGVAVTPDGDAPLLSLGRLVQQDFCILQGQGAEHVLTGAILCFPASWRLAEKFGQPLGTIHAPVREYDSGLATRVQRLFDAVRPGAPLWRANVLAYADPALHHPQAKGDGPAVYVRSERQAIARLPETGAVIFSIHTSIVPRAALTPEQAAALGAP